MPVSIQPSSTSLGSDRRESDATAFVVFISDVETLADSEVDSGRSTDCNNSGQTKVKYLFNIFLVLTPMVLYALGSGFLYAVSRSLNVKMTFAMFMSIVAIPLVCMFLFCVANNLIAESEFKKSLRGLSQAEKMGKIEANEMREEKEHIGIAIRTAWLTLFGFISIAIMVLSAAHYKQNMTPSEPTAGV